MNVRAAPADKDVPSRSEFALTARLGRVPNRLTLAELPTPVDRAAWLDTPHAKVWVKRDDLSSEVYGGGKVRKLEWILANPPFDRDQPILSVGGVGSHHLLALALFLQTQGRELHGLTFTQSLTPHVRKNLAVLLSTGASLWNVDSRAELPLAWLRYHVLRRPPVKGQSMAAGASTPLGCFGFVDAAFELKAQVDAGLLPRPDILYVTAGSAGTSAGLALGFALAGMPVHLRMVSSVEPWAFNAMMLHLKMRGALKALIEAGLETPHATPWALMREAGVSYSIDFAEVGAGYGEPTARGLDAVAVAQEHALSLEPTYTAKCIAALRRHEAHDDGRARNVLFWHTHAGNDLSPRIEPGWEARSPVTFEAPA